MKVPQLFQGTRSCIGLLVSSSGRALVFARLAMARPPAQGWGLQKETGWVALGIARHTFGTALVTRCARRGSEMKTYKRTSRTLGFRRQRV